jgi:hypothetical protein
MAQFIFKFTDGKYLRNIGKNSCESKRNYDWWVSHSFGADFTDGVLERLEECKTDDINEAQLFTTERSIQCSNCYTWGGTIHEVDVTIVPRK